GGGDLDGSMLERPHAKFKDRTFGNARQPEFPEQLTSVAGASEPESLLELDRAGGETGPPANPGSIAQAIIAMKLRCLTQLRPGDSAQLQNRLDVQAPSAGGPRGEELARPSLHVSEDLRSAEDLSRSETAQVIHNEIVAWGQEAETLHDGSVGEVNRDLSH